MRTLLIDRAMQSRAQPDDRPGEFTASDWCAIGELFAIAVLLTLYCIVRFPELGAVIAQYNQF